jgi:Na+-driven multidrug efflux pump
MSLAAVALLVAEEGGEHEVNQAVSWGIGGLALAILFGLMIALIAFGGGREHS